MAVGDRRDQQPYDEEYAADDHLPQPALAQDGAPARPGDLVWPGRAHDWHRARHAGRRAGHARHRDGCVRCSGLGACSRHEGRVEWLRCCHGVLAPVRTGSATAPVPFPDWPLIVATVTAYTWLLRAIERARRPG